MPETKIQFFASIKDLVGSNFLEINMPPGATVADLKSYLVANYPVLKSQLPNASVSINQKYAFNEDIIPPEADVAIFPPVSGGEGYPTVVKITIEPICQDELVKQITLDETGGCCIFCGTVRGLTDKGEPYRTRYLEYEAYVPMAEGKMLQIAQEIRTRWPKVQGVAIVQRIGHLEPGTPTVLIACAAAHRHDGIFDAVHYGIDRLKEIVPVWKKEVDENGSTWIEGDYLPQKGD